MLIKTKAERSEAERSVFQTAETIQGTSLRYVGRRSVKVKAKRILLLCINLCHSIIRLFKIWPYHY
ncbi:unnamed protein product [Plutella xylostella]|uniref:(diamondback moth) hypothetical protein n=1 Tax=Plutella xylostella TaxID=51655 RepID=A0A8S4G6B6_PLUXY|nr:unnamed protein product [Plutella xylostella]